MFAHDSLRDALYDQLKISGSRVEREVNVSSSFGRDARMDLVWERSGGPPVVYLDVTIGHPLQSNGTPLGGTARRTQPPGRVCVEAEQRKRRQNEEGIRAGACFVPIAVSTYGRYGADAVKFLQLACKTRNRSSTVFENDPAARFAARSNLFSVLSVALWRGNARRVLLSRGERVEGGLNVQDLHPAPPFLQQATM